MNCFFGSKYGFNNLVVVWGGGGECWRDEKFDSWLLIYCR